MFATLLVSCALSFLLLTFAFLIFLKAKLAHAKRFAFVIILLSIFPFALSAYIVFFLFNSEVGDAQVKLHDKVIYSKKTLFLAEGKAVVHVVSFDVDDVEIKLTPPVGINSTAEYQARTATDALIEFNADLAINASFFHPFRDVHLFDYYPHKGDPVKPIGITYSHKQLYGLPERGWPVLMFTQEGELSIEAYQQDKFSEEVLSNLRFLISGHSRLVTDGHPSPVDIQNLRDYPRAAIGLSKDRDRVWIIVADGKQPFYSKGINLVDLSNYLVSIGVYDALELDGGGSATMAWINDIGEAELLSRPAHTKIPNRQRPVANHLLVYFR